MKVEVKMLTNSASPKGNFSKGQTRIVDKGEAKVLTDNKFAEFVRYIPEDSKTKDSKPKEVETASLKPSEDAKLDYVGGGWYEVGGKKVHGKSEALKQLGKVK